MLLLPFLPSAFFGVCALGLSMLASLWVQPGGVEGDHRRAVRNRTVAVAAAVAALLCLAFLGIGLLRAAAHLVHELQPLTAGERD